jgi:putative transposase
MRQSRFTEEQISYALKQVDSGEPVVTVCRTLGISQQTFYQWRRKYQGHGGG